MVLAVVKVNLIYLSYSKSLIVLLSPTRLTVIVKEIISLSTQFLAVEKETVKLRVALVKPPVGKLNDYVACN